jgi:hypothetical protein
MGLAGVGPADQDGVALMSNEVAAGEIPHQRLVDRVSSKTKSSIFQSQRQLGDGDLNFVHRTCLSESSPSGGRKIHMLTDTFGRSLRLILTAGQASNVTAAPDLLEGQEGMCRAHRQSP